MSVSARLWAANGDLADEALTGRFVRALGDGSLAGDACEAAVEHPEAP